MAGRRSKHVRRFLQAAKARLEEAEYLRGGGMSLGAVYLAGYAVECVLKALVLSGVSEHEQPAAIAQFRGRVGHDFGWLKFRYTQAGGASLPKPVAAAVLTVGAWETDLRYAPRKEYDGDAGEFFAAVAVIMTWANGRV